MKKNSQIHFYIETEVLKTLKIQASNEGITLSKLCREKLRDYSILSKLQDTLDEINKKISKEEKILDLLNLGIKQNTKLNGGKKWENIQKSIESLSRVQKLTKKSITF